MRFKINLFIILVLFSSALYAKHVTVAEARLTAKSVISEHFSNSDAALQDNLDPITLRSNGLELIYVFQLHPTGFILISADDASYPVLAYSAESDYPDTDMPENFSAWLKGYKDQIEFGIGHSVNPDQKTTLAWQSYLSGTSPVTKNANTAVSPMLSTTWDQGFPYNYLCPVDAGGSGGHVWAGCVATAMSQVVNYWRWPLQGTGSHGYYSSYGYLSADYGATRYKWEEMTNSTSVQNFQMAQLQSHLGISVDMMYSPSGSGAYSDDAANALKTYFGYDSNLHLEYAPSPIDETWKSTLRTELEAGHPLYYHGFGTGGHAFNVDGYQGTDYFHFNWGWSGSYNGYFYLDNLNPGGYSFTEGQGAIVGIVPTGNYPYYCSSTDTLRATAGTIEDGSGPLAPYLGNTHCGWLIAPNDSISSVSINFHRFDLENNVDFLSIYDGEDTTANLLGSFTGSNLPGTVTSTGGKMFIKFTTSSTGNAGGWFASYNCAKAVFCTGVTTLTAPYGSVSDGSGSFNYHENTLCKFKIVPDSVKAISITFDQFDTYDQNDILMIFNQENNDLLYKLYGNQNPGTLYFNTGKLLLMFHSNNSDNAQGWSFHYSSSITTGTDDFSKQAVAQIFPDPADQNLNIRLQSQKDIPVSLELYSLQGTKVYQNSYKIQKGEFAGQIDVSTYPNGIYLLRIASSDGVLTHRVIVNH
ncbi:MAG: C10 family peptidase [Bacteroidetes bacterium]|nr:C10 family peptidase [Bacteroidota bacterium]